MLGTLMFATKVAMAALPNIHLVGMLTMVYTLVFRKKALIPLYLYIFLEGLYGGFSAYWLPYLYVWAVLWGVTVLLPRDMSKRAKYIVYPLVCCLHGLLFGTLFAPGYALIAGLSLKGMLAWIVSGLPFDALHGAGNLAAGFLIVPLSELLARLSGKINRETPQPEENTKAPDSAEK